MIYTLKSIWIVQKNPNKIKEKRKWWEIKWVCIDQVDVVIVRVETPDRMWSLIDWSNLPPN